MAYNQSQHQVWVERLTNWVRNQKAAYVEARELLAIYSYLAAAGQHEAFVDTANLTTAEMQSAVSLLSRQMNGLALDDQDVTITPENQAPRLAPFL